MMIKTIMIPGIAALTFIVGVIWLLTLAWSDPLAVIQSAAAKGKSSYASPIHSGCREASPAFQTSYLHHVGKPDDRARSVHVAGTMTTDAATR
jgi:hypothetical protein